jgi:nitrogen fixation/metabolism regulation signal transduction histidine kinase
MAQDGASAPIVKEIIGRIDSLDQMMKDLLLFARPPKPRRVPFFTTKSRGSGLGLPTAKRIVEAHHGEIAVDCPPGGGTTVVVRLPIDTAAQ